MTSASSLHRVIECPASAVLPAVVTTSAAATRGQDVHAYLRRVISGLRRSAALAHVAPDNRTTCEGLDFAKILDSLKEARTEVAYAYNATTCDAKELGVNLGRNYPREYCELPWIPGSVDMVARGEDGTWIVEDFKSGQPVAAAAENPQLMFFALVLRALHKTDAIEIRIRYIREDGRTWVDSHRPDAYELDSFRFDLDHLVGRVYAANRQYAETQTVNVSAGDWCRYCSSGPVCPSKVSLARAMQTDVATLHATIGAMTPVERGAAWVKAKQIESILEHVITGLRECAIAEPTPLPDGKVLRMVESQRRSFVQADALNLMKRLGATEDQIDSVYRTVPVETVRSTKATTQERKEKAA